MKLLIVATLLYSFHASASWTKKAKSHLPERVQKLELGKTDRSSARKLLGRPDHIQGDKDYWIFDGFKYALELTYKNNRLKILHFNFPKKGFPVETLKGEIDPKRLVTSPTSPQKALFYEDKDGKFEVDLSTGRVGSVRFQ